MILILVFTIFHNASCRPGAAQRKTNPTQVAVELEQIKIKYVLFLVSDFRMSFLCRLLCISAAVYAKLHANIHEA